jgi:hypothetical protein
MTAPAQKRATLKVFRASLFRSQQTMSDIPVLSTKTNRSGKSHTDWTEAYRLIQLEPEQRTSLTDCVNALFESSTPSYNPAIPSIIGGVTNKQREMLIKAFKDGSINQLAKDWNRNAQRYHDFEMRVIPKIEALVNQEEGDKRAAELAKHVPDNWTTIKIECGCQVYFKDVGMVYTICPMGHGRVLTTPEVLKRAQALQKKLVATNRTETI